MLLHACSFDILRLFATLFGGTSQPSRYSFGPSNKERQPTITRTTMKTTTRLRLMTMTMTEAPDIGRCSSKVDPARPTGQPGSNSARERLRERPGEKERSLEGSALWRCTKK